MTAERYFALIGEDGYVYPVFFDSEDEDKEIDVDTVVDLLNENGRLKQANSQLAKVNREGVKKVQKLAKENEQLKTQLQNISDQRDEFHRGARENANRVGKLEKENEQLKQDNNALIHLLENQSMIIEELHFKLLEYQVKEPIALTKKDLELMDKAISYYTHGRCGE